MEIIRATGERLGISRARWSRFLLKVGEPFHGAKNERRKGEQKRNQQVGPHREVSLPGARQTGQLADSAAS